MKRLLLLIAVIAACSCHCAFAQDRTITGKVTSSEDQKTIPGVSVYVKGTTIATSTDIDGNYKLMVPASGKTIVFSSVGMKTKEAELGASNVIDAVMEPDVLKLNEVVVTALGIEREQRSLGYSTTKVDGGSVEKSREANVINSLAGKVAGIQVTSSGGVPGASSKILLRGNKSILLESQPLMVIDGVPMDNRTRSIGNTKDYPFNPYLEQVNYSNRGIDINPDDIDNIQVLKGPAAAVLYGERGANGAIIITTKRAKYGQKTEVTVSSNVAWDMVNKLPKFQETYAQGVGGGSSLSTPVYKTRTPGADGIFGTADDGAGTPNSWGPTMSSLGISPTDNVKDFFQTGMTYTSDVSVSSGSEKNAFRASLSNTSQSGIVPNTDFKRWSFRINTQSQFSNKISVQGYANLITDGTRRAQQGSNLSGTMLSLFRTPESYNLRAYEANGYEYDNGTEANYFANYDNPLWSALNNVYSDRNTRFIGNVTLMYLPKDWLKFTFRPGIDTYTDQISSIYAVGSKNSFQTQPGQVTDGSAYYQEINTDIIGTVTHDFSKKFSGTLNVGWNLNQQLDDEVYARGRNLAINKFYNLGNASDLYGENNTNRQRGMAGFADFSFAYNELLFLGITGRDQYSSTFGANKRSFFFPGANLSFIFTELSSLKKNPKTLSFGKLRFAYATAGKSPQAYSSINTFYKPFFTDGFTNGFSFPYQGPGGNVIGYADGQVIKNPDLEPELTTGIEYGVDLKLFQDRVNVSLTLYNQHSKNLLIQQPIPFSTGNWFILNNLGEMTNKGIELEVGGTPIKTKNFTWLIEANYAKNQNEVTKLVKGAEQIEVEVGFGDPGVFIKENEPFGVIYGTTWERNSGGQLIIGTDGLPIPSVQLSKIGDGFPEITAGIRNTFTYKNLTLSGLIDIRGKFQIWNGTQARLNRIGRSEDSQDREHTFIIEGVKQDGTPNNVPVEAIDYWQVYKGDFGASENTIQEASWVRLREISLGYTFKDLKKVFRSIELTLMARNLWLKTDYAGIDPEQSLTGAGSKYSGVDWFGMPNTKSINFGVKATY